MATAQSNGAAPALDQNLFDQMLEQAVASSSDNESSRASGAQLEPAVSRAIAEDIFAQLEVSRLEPPPGSDERQQREHLARICAADQAHLLARAGAIIDWATALSEANCFYVEDRTDCHVSNREGHNAWQIVGDLDEARAKNRARKELEAASELDLDVPDLREPSWLTHERIESTSLDTLYGQARAAFGELTERVVAASLSTLTKNSGKFSAGKHSATYTFATHLVTDKLERENISTEVTEGNHTELRATTEGKRTVSRVTQSHDLLHPQRFDYAATLNNPRLLLPPRYRAILEQAPPELRPHLTSVFGTQFNEQKEVLDLSSKRITERFTLARYLACEPCVLFGGHTVLFGWGADLMKQTDELYSEQRQLLDEQRRYLDTAQRKMGSFWTSMKLGCGFLLLLSLQLWFAISIGSGLAALLISPSLVFALALLFFAGRCTLRSSKAAAAEAEHILNHGYERLAVKYSAFDPDHPQLHQPEERNESL